MKEFDIALQLSIFNFQFSTFNFQLSIFNFQLWTDFGRSGYAVGLSAISFSAPLQKDAAPIPNAGRPPRKQIRGRKKYSPLMTQMGTNFCNWKLKVENWKFFIFILLAADESLWRFYVRWRSSLFSSLTVLVLSWRLLVSTESDETIAMYQRHP